eukprot:8309606-Karenia_brevis.AAC.1
MFAFGQESCCSDEVQVSSTVAEAIRSQGVCTQGKIRTYRQLRRRRSDQSQCNSSFWQQMEPGGYVHPALPVESAHTEAGK